MIRTYPLVSIMISVYNQLHCVATALESALNQDYQNIEIIISDDCSSDGNVEEFITSIGDSRVKYFRNEANLGIGGNYRNLLYRRSKGKYVTMLNADDYLSDPNYISKAVKILESQENIKLVFGRTQILLMFENRFVEDSKMQDLQQVFSGNWLLLNQVKGYVIPHLTAVYDRELAINIDFYRTEYISDDWDSMLRLIQGYKVGFVKSMSGIFGRHDSNVSKTINIDSIFGNKTFIESNYSWAIKLGQIKKDVLDNWREEMLYRYFVKNYIKISLWENDNIEFYLDRLKKEHFAIHQKIRTDIRVKVFNIIKKWPKILSFIFSKYLKQESVIADFLQFVKNKK